MNVNVFLVGAGPGDPGMITRRGLELIRTCDVLLYDRLVAAVLVAEAPEGADVIFVGKNPGETSMPQAAIDRLVVTKARENKRVVRLKGGDPFVFGRGGDEAQALAAAGIAFEIVPGVSAATAVPAYAGIPVTHGGVSSSFAVLTGHETSPRPGSAERFAAVAAGAETLVLLMGAASLEETSRRLIEAGRARDEPVAMIERGSTPRQRTIVATVATMAEAARRERVQAPVTTVIGRVVAMRDGIAWFEQRPLFGRRIVVTRALAQAGPLVAALEELGGDVIALPTIEITEPESFDDLDAAIDRLSAGSYTWVLFASVNAVDRFMERLQRDRDVRAFARTRVAAVGPRTAEALLRHGIRADLVPHTFEATAAAAAMGPGAGRVLLPRPADAPTDVVEALREQAWEVDEATAYRTVTAAPAPEHVDLVRRGEFDGIVFASASAVHNLVRILGSRPPSLESGEAWVACIGPSTAAAAEDVGLRVDVVPEQHTTQSLVHAIVQLGPRKLRS
ncbi:MAG: uroporphyrinogen-III C-methyltransferase [Actinomycetota bacterium]|nr:uroporphyrinogen-III C-methyltransferase [Actinomycetota bacterium]